MNTTFSSQHTPTMKLTNFKKTIEENCTEFYHRTQH